MKAMEILKKLREQANSLKSVDNEKYQLISEILKEDNCFQCMDMETAYSILMDLQVEDIDKVYIELMKRK